MIRTQDSFLLLYSPCYFFSCQVKIPWTIAHQAPLSLGCSRQEYWSELPLPSPEDLPYPRIKSVSPALAGWFFTTEFHEENLLLSLALIFYLQVSLKLQNVWNSDTTAELKQRKRRMKSSSQRAYAECVSHQRNKFLSVPFAAISFIVQLYLQSS